MNDLRVTFPKPCSEDWEAMAPSGCNRHCSKCDRVIHDLSEMTTDEIEELARSEDAPCVRAVIMTDGSVATANVADAGKRRIMAAVGASLSLAVAACQTTSEPRVTPLYTVSGSTDWGTGDRTVTLTRSDGETKRKKVSPRRDFSFNNLHAGTYELRVESWCADPIVQQIEIGSTDIEVGEIVMESECIIVGVMVPASRRTRG
ncbi:hypothetical protein KUW15_08360 [Qipengyuania aquimaris]|uniref:hypothetical protein n=1 Tax=Qipengyuania aquimaris TaxID=255984 RepID=UPI001C97680C|nr:hypothetical protein [Qipengyuania aquimaris]MBY6128724.1 hypothetical protein [Qipengyuania aquimaris]